MHKIKNHVRGSAFVSCAPLGYRVGAHGYIQRRGTVWAWKDYPLFRHEERKQAPIRKVRVLCWDGNKIELVRWNRRLWNFKIGYIYSTHGRCGEVSPIRNHVPENNWYIDKL